ncbi:hypothetical protein [Hydrogenimonas cancrithermarum]|uniref:Uncharacterized protein n=1 Tax=Hydrogenimonas cancrithermarum TaxID=2993563 RepID=A0ABM8FM18_9BACT|nr:hypothetical protein [Hydrogenimonas cancrithermarum]BDY13401.1 hypothetical protein HCR_17130 [Hydrogenimonas cancrithermarum]
MMNDAVFFIVLLILCEIFESWWQHAPTLGGVLEKVRHYYHIDIFVLLLMHPSFWLVLFIFLYQGGRGTLLSLILVMKAADLAFKLWMVRKIDEGALSAEFRGMLSVPLSPWMPWINVVIYPALLAMALTG